MNFKDEQEEKHKQVEEALKQQEDGLSKLAQKLNSEIDSKTNVKVDHKNKLVQVSKVNDEISKSKVDLKK